MPEEPISPQPIPSRPASEEQKAWHAYRRASQQEEPKRLEEAAKFLAGMVSITFTILLSADRSLLQGHAPGWQAVASVLWLIALLLAFLVLFPRPYRFAASSAQSIEQMHRKVVRWKARVLAAAVIAFLLGFGLLTGLYITAKQGSVFREQGTAPVESIREFIPSPSLA